MLDTDSWSLSGIGYQNRSLLAGLTTVEPLGINAVPEDEWVEVEATVDSGASETVMGEKTLNGVIGITEGPAFERGVKYECADGEQIPNFGDRKNSFHRGGAGKRSHCTSVRSKSDTYECEQGRRVRKQSGFRL